MQHARVAAVRYLNTLPLIAGLEHARGLDLIPAVPSSIEPMVRHGHADLGLVSIIDGARHADELTVLPVGMIGCDGPTLTVRVFSSVPLEQAKTLHADTDSHTSTVLAQVVLAERFGVRPMVADFDARERWPSPGEGRDLDVHWPETVLLIGDKVVTDPPPQDRYPHQLDLGDAWRDATGLPFVYAAWMARTERAGSLGAAAALLDRQRRANAGRLDEIARIGAREHRWPEDIACRYLGSLLRYEIGEREREAAHRFVELAARHGLCPHAILRWADAPAGC